MPNPPPARGAFGEGYAQRERRSPRHPGCQRARRSGPDRPDLRLLAQGRECSLTRSAPFRRRPPSAYCPATSGHGPRAAEGRALGHRTAGRRTRATYLGQARRALRRAFQAHAQQARGGLLEAVRRPSPPLPARLRERGCFDSYATRCCRGEDLTDLHPAESRTGFGVEPGVGACPRAFPHPSRHPQRTLTALLDTS